jgi:hypothetical protein
MEGLGRSQTKQIVIRMTESDFTRLKKKVEQSGLSQAEYLRQAVLNKRIVSTEGITELIKELKRIGINLNQIARNSNTGTAATHSEIQRISEDLGGIWLLLRRFLQERA